MKLRDVLPALEAIAPLRYAEPWDNVGLLAGDPDRDATTALLCIDYTPAVAREARDLGCDLVIAYHPPIFEGLKRITAPGLIYAAIRDGIALYAPHTALDIAPGGTNDVLADLLGLVERAPLQRLDPRVAQGAPDAAPLGIGRVGRLSAPTPLGALLARIKDGLGVESLLVSTPEGVNEGTLIAQAAACAGACGKLFEQAIAQGAALYLTGELRHHDALKAAQAGMTVVCALHSNSERATLSRVKARLEDALPALRVHLGAQDRDPFAIR
ncbi:MAG TPA: Nif3-like dinuclear metal center hexameric protein [Candidatus Nanopelagicales bacterium]|nr:Nif3-like dinuclear metal center hexameric protein [Candidatus Nanopelagicales bacterium]